MADAAKIERLEAYLEALWSVRISKAGVLSVTVDGQTTRFESHKDLREEIEATERQLSRAKGKRPITGSIDMRGALG